MCFGTVQSDFFLTEIQLVQGEGRVVDWTTEPCQVPQIQQWPRSCRCLRIAGKLSRYLLWMTNMEASSLRWRLQWILECFQLTWKQRWQNGGSRWPPPLLSASMLPFILSCQVNIPIFKFWTVDDIPQRSINPCKHLYMVGLVGEKNGAVHDNYFKGLNTLYIFYEPWRANHIARHVTIDMWRLLYMYIIIFNLSYSWVPQGEMWLQMHSLHLSLKRALHLLLYFPHCRE